MCLADYKLTIVNGTLCVLLLLCAACTPREPEYVRFNGGYADYSCYLGQTDAFVPMLEQSSDVQDPSLWCNIYEDLQFTPDGKVSQLPPVRRTSPVTMTDMARAFLESALTYKVHQVAGTYRSVGIRGDSLTLSGKFLYPEDGVIKNLMIVSHYTIGANHEAPSETFSFEGIFAAMGYGVIIADYIGFGVTVDSLHPYLQSETTARNVIDMALAVLPFVAQRGLRVQSDSVFLMGYSQGGATTMHVQRLLEDSVHYPEYHGQFAIKKNYAGAGPYDIARTYDYSVKEDVTGIPCAVPMIIQGMSIGMEHPLDMSFFFRDRLLENYQDWLNSKKYTVNQMSSLIGVNRLSAVLTPNGIDRTKPETARFYRELISNSIPEEFVPRAPLYMFHSEDDQTVPFINSQIMQRQFRRHPADVTYDFGHYGTHMKGALKFFGAVSKDLKKINQ
ncbi:MAG: alpha/beta hydrolase family protein [Paludibacteraceae bacterium]